MRKLLLGSLALGMSAVVSGASAQPARPAPAPAVAQKVAPATPMQQVLAADPDVADYKVARVRVAQHNAKLKPILAADPRVKALTEQFRAALKITDARARKAKLDAMAPQVLAVRRDAFAKAKLTENEIQTDLAPIKQKVRPRPPKPAELPKKEVVNVSSFPETTTFKAACTDQSDTWDFDGKLVNVHASSTPGDNDCAHISAGRRTSTIDVPGGGVTRVDISATVKVDLFTAAMAFGVYAKAVNNWGITITSPEGLPLSKMKIGNVMQDVPAAICKLNSSDAVNPGWNPIPFDFGNYEADLQDGDADNTCSFVLPNGIRKLEVGMYTSGWVDADVLGVAEMDNKITPKSVKLTFFRP